MPKLKTLSGSDLISIFAYFGFAVVSQKGSHVKLRRTLASGHRQNLTIPNHAEVDKGTLRAIHRQALRYVSEEQLQSHFFTADQ